MNRTIYVSHPYSNNEMNKERVEGIIRKLSEDNPHLTFISPIHTFGFMYEDVSYEQGMKYCLDLLDKCDAMFVFGNHRGSNGCTIEINHAREKGIPYHIL